MGRIIGSVVLGYVVVFAVVFLLMGAAYFGLGEARVFRPDSWDVSGLWAVITFVVGFVAAVAAGYVCAAVAKDPRGPLALIALVIVLGVLFAIPVLTGGAEVAELGPRPDTVPMFDAMSNIRQPAWIALSNPVIGAIGVWVGARLKRSAATQASA